MWTTIGELLINRDNERIPLSLAIRKRQSNKQYDYYGAAGVIDKVSDYIFSEQLLLIGEDGANLLSRSKNNAFFADGKYWVNNHAHVLDCTHKPVLTYVAFVINSISLEPYITGSAQPKLSQDNLNRIPVPLPPITEQCRIISAVEKWDSVIRLLEKEKAELGNMISYAKSKILDLAIHGKLVPQDPNDELAIDLLRRINPDFKPCDNAHYQYNLPDNWEWTTLGNIGKWQSGGTPDRKNKSYYNGEIPWLRIADLQDDYITEATEFITQEGLNNSSTKFNPIGSVALAMYGSIGKVGILTFPSTTNQAICVCSNYIIAQKYLFYYLISQRDNFFMQAGGGVQANISKQIIVKHPIPIPPLPEQHRIVAKIEELFATLDKIKKSLEA